MSKQLLIVAHCPSPNTQAMGDALFAGAQSLAPNDISIRLASPFECDAQDVLTADAVILFTTENFGYMSGALKDFFDRIYYPCLNDQKRNQAKPYALVIKAGLDGTGTDVAVHKIIAGLSWKEVFPVLLCKGEFQPEFVQQCNELGQAMIASLDADVI